MISDDSSNIEEKQEEEDIYYSNSIENRKSKNVFIDIFSMLTSPDYDFMNIYLID